MTGYRLCDNCALKYADCKGDKDLEKTRCDYYKKPVVLNVKELAERVAELELENKKLKENAVSREGVIAYVCDGRKCGGECSECGRTTDITHAKNFTRIVDSYFEKLQVVRCKDCIMLNTDDRRMGKAWCSWLLMFMYENDFCSNGERRE